MSQSLADEIQGLAKRVDSGFFDFNASLRHLDIDLKKLNSKGAVKCKYLSEGICESLLS